MENPLCILTAGRGTRTGHSMNKALLPLNDKAAISHLIDKTSGDVVIAVGYDAVKVMEYCTAAHPDRNITFVNVDNFDGPGSGPGYSLRCCRQYLQRPFLLTTVDCLVSEDYPEATDWVGVAPTSNPSQFCTFDVQDGYVTNMVNKGDGFPQAFIGLCSIQSYETFWEKLVPGEGEFELVDVFRNWRLEAKAFTWFDIGTADNYAATKKVWEGGFNFSKKDECTYFVGNRVVKLFNDPDRAQSRIRRGDLLQPATPPILYRGRHTYSYEKVDGQTLYEQPRDLLKLLEWCQHQLWKEKDVSGFRDWCWKFYHDKTFQRLKLYQDKYPQDEIHLNINWGRLGRGKCVLFHGDLQFDNILYNDRFYLLDWREALDGFDYGDMYYDLAKLYGGILLPYSHIKKGLFHFQDGEYDFERLHDEKELVQTLKTWVKGNGYEWERVETLTALIYLNMAPLHEYPFDRLLFYHAKKLLQVPSYSKRPSVLWLSPGTSFLQEFLALHPDVSYCYHDPQVKRFGREEFAALTPLDFRERWASLGISVPTKASNPFYYLVCGTCPDIPSNFKKVVTNQDVEGAFKVDLVTPQTLYDLLHWLDLDVTKSCRQYAELTTNRQKPPLPNVPTN